MKYRSALTLFDIPWLRRASAKAGALAVPQPIATKLVAAGLVELDVARQCLTITARGRLALAKLG